MTTSIPIHNDNIPKEWVEKCFKGEKGGLFLVFINAPTQKELNKKVVKLNKFCREMKHEKPRLKK